MILGSESEALSVEVAIHVASSVTEAQLHATGIPVVLVVYNVNVYVITPVGVIVCYYPSDNLYNSYTSS